MPTTKSSIGSGARKRILTSTRSPEWNTWPTWPSAPTKSTCVISISREPHRPSAARNMSASPVAVSTGLSGSTADDGSSGETIAASARSEEHTSELQSHVNLVCRLLLEKKNEERAIDIADLGEQRPTNLELAAAAPHG